MGRSEQGLTSQGTRLATGGPWTGRRHVLEATNRVHGLPADELEYVTTVGLAESPRPSLPLPARQLFVAGASHLTWLDGGAINKRWVTRRIPRKGGCPDVFIIPGAAV